MNRLLSFVLAAALLLSLCACGQQAEPQPPVSSAPAEDEPQLQTQPEQTGAPTFPTVSGEMDPYNLTWGEMQNADFWIALADDPQALRMTAEEIAAYNASLCSAEGTKVEDLSVWPESLSRQELAALLDTYGEMPNAGYYTPEGRLTVHQQETMGANRNKAAVAEQNPLRYGFLTENLILRTFPSDIPLYDSPDTWEYDKAAETALKLWEPVLVLHTSADGEWLLVQAYDYLGWVETNKVALCEKDIWDWLRGELSAHFLTVLAPRLVLDGSFSQPGQESVVLKMGTILPLVTDASEADNATADNCHLVLLPRRGAGGALETYTARIPQTEDVTVGSLPFTTENLLTQVFKLLGHRYGWGGTAEGWDCSSICQDAYRTVGLFLPRNSGSQRQLPGWHNVENTSNNEKQALLETLLPGAMLELRGHQTMYIGTFAGESYVIHATHGVYDELGGFYNANSVIVSSVQARRSNGKTLLENFRGFSMPAALSQ